MRVRFAPFLAVFALAGCGVLGDEAEKPAAVSPDDLARMVVPSSELGPGLGKFKPDLDDSGRESAAKAAEGTVEPKDTAKSIRRRGWLDGYLLEYSNPDFEPGSETGLFSAQTGTDLFATESAARALMLEEVADFKRYSGKTLEGAKLERVDVFDASVGEEAVGIGYQARVGKRRIYVTGVLFRRGRIVGSASFARTDKTVMRADTLRIADRLDERIQSTLRGELLARPLPPSVDLDPVALVLTKADMPSRSRIIAQGVGAGGDRAQNTYARQFDLANVHLGSSIIRSVRAEVRVYKTARTASAATRAISGRTGTKTFAREFARGVRMGGFVPRNLTVKTIRLGGYAGMDVSFKAPLGRFETVLLVVRMGRAVQAVAVYGYDKNLHPADAVVFVQKARARMKKILG